MLISLNIAVELCTVDVNKWRKCGTIIFKTVLTIMLRILYSCTGVGLKRFAEHEIKWDKIVVFQTLVRVKQIVSAFQSCFGVYNTLKNKAGRICEINLFAWNNRYFISVFILCCASYIICSSTGLIPHGAWLTWEISGPCPFDLYGPHNYWHISSRGDASWGPP